MRALDISDNYGDYLERDSFISYMEQRTHQWPSHDDVIEAFRVFDHEGQGYIKTSQLKKLMQSAQLDVDENASKLDIIMYFYSIFTNLTCRHNL